VSLTAIVKNIPEAKQTVGAQKRLLDYCVQPHKVELDEQLCFVSGINCMPELAHESFIATQKLWEHPSGTPRFYQYVQSFSPDEKVTPEIVHEIGCEFAKQFGNREILVATHIDREHLHNHFVICAYDIDTGVKYVSGKTHLAELRRESDRICQAYGLTTLPTYDPKKKSANLDAREYRAAIKGDSWKLRLCADIDFCMRYARSKKEFRRLMRERGYRMVWEDSRKYITYIANVNGEEKRVRDIKLHEEKYRKERMEDELGIRQELFGAAQGEERAADIARTTAAGEDGANFRSGLRAADDSACESRTAGGQRVAGGAVDSGSAKGNGGIRGEADTHDSRAVADGTEGDQPGDCTERRTGWESERESLRLSLASGTAGRSAVVAEADSVRTAIDPVSLVVGTVGILGSGNVVDEESEEERREREARNAGSALGLAAGLAIGAALSQKKDDEADEEDEDYDTFPKLSM